MKDYNELTNETNEKKKWAAVNQHLYRVVGLCCVGGDYRLVDTSLWAAHETEALAHAEWEVRAAGDELAVVGWPQPPRVTRLYQIDPAFVLFVLLPLPEMTSYANRSALLKGLPAALVHSIPRDNSYETDLFTIVSAVADQGRLAADGRLALWDLVWNVFPMVTPKVEQTLRLGCRFDAVV